MPTYLGLDNWHQIEFYESHKFLSLMLIFKNNSNLAPPKPTYNWTVTIHYNALSFYENSLGFWNHLSNLRYFHQKRSKVRLTVGKFSHFFVKYRGACRLTNNVSNSLWTCNLIITIKTCYTIIIHKRIYVWFHLNNLCLKLWTLVIFHILQRLTFFSMNHGHYVSFFCLQPLY